MSSRKRLHTSSEAINYEANRILRFDIAPKPVIKGKKTTTIDDEKIYYTSEPPGKDYKDSMLTMRDLTNMMCPLVKYRIKHYGYNYAGLHQNDIPTTATNANSPLQVSNHRTDYRRFTTSDLGINQNADTIAWTGGTQAWFEAVSLPLNFDVANNIIKAQPSIDAMINMAYRSLSHMNNTSNEHPEDHVARDFFIHYNGGSQTHTFVNQNESEVYYELWELVPREQIQWFKFREDSELDDYVESLNIHTLVRYAYEQQDPLTTSTEYPVNDPGTHILYPNDHPTAASHVINSNGQRIRTKNQPGFRINKECVDLYKNFRVSKSQKGSMKPGSMMQYKLQHGPVKMLNSSFRRYLLDETVNTYQGNQTENSRNGTLIPAFSKILVVRFWSELGQLQNIFDEPADSAAVSPTWKFSYRDVTNVAGHMLHTVYENHAIRVVPYVKQNITITKDFTNIEYLNTSVNNNFRTVNDAQNLSQISSSIN